MSIGTEKFSFFVIENFPLGAFDRFPGHGVGGVCRGGAVGNRVGAATATSLAATTRLAGRRLQEARRCGRVREQVA